MLATTWWLEPSTLQSDPSAVSPLAKQGNNLLFRCPKIQCCGFGSGHIGTFLSEFRTDPTFSDLNDKWFYQFF